MMSNNVLVSLIIPIYNGEKYINNFLKMLKLQSFQEFEVILVNDGSTDKTADLLKNIDDERIFVFYQENKGVSSARNLGIKHASGKFFIFPDIDDQISESYIKNLVNCQSEISRLTFSGYVEKNRDGKSLFKYIPKKNFYQNKLYFIDDMVKHHGICTALWNKAFLGEIIRKNKITFDENISIGEDLLFILSYLYYVNRIVSVKEADYSYILNPSGAMNVSNSAFSYKESWNSEWNALKKAENLILIMCNKPSTQITYKKYRVASKLLYFSKKFNYNLATTPKNEMKNELRKNFVNYFFRSNDEFRMKLRVFKRLLRTI